MDAAIVKVRALVVEKARLEARLAEIHALLEPLTGNAPTPTKRRYKLSTVTRRRMREAWARRKAATKVTAKAKKDA